VRGVLYTLTENTGALVAIQILDGVAAAIFGVVSVLVIADLTQGSGRFNLTLGAISMAVGIGASLTPGHRRFDCASPWFQRGLSVSCRSGGDRIWYPLLLHAGDAR
jgi:xanthine/uracil permease